ncbi:hypothetical protein Sango_2073500 [Sesamum angolense]|uniref:Uncharacterized protein n=1 Tax=Sesamum angolense TaxID=2727404 RepID=A0AAE1WB92_9LAMI|nr:hypothetical protein Sango_2073500 [Sesamum angolense]
MYDKNFLRRAGLTPEFDDRVKNFIEWAKCQHGYMNEDKIRACPTDADPSSRYGRGPYGYVPELSDHFYDVVHIVDKLLWSSCTQSQLALVAGLKDDVDLKYCKFYGDVRYKPTRERDPRHKKSRMLFLEEPRNVRLGLWKDGFASHGQYDRTYSCWPIILTPYNLPPVCIDDTRAFHPQHSRKECYFNCYRQFLLVDHTYRRNKKTFTKDRVKYMVACPRLTGEEIRNWVADFSPAVEQLLTLPSDHGSDNKWMKKTIFWDIPY